MSITPEKIVERCNSVMAHAWMVRTFVKHSEEAEDFPELMQVARAVFDTSRALEVHASDPDRYLKMLAKKIGRLRRAAEAFRVEAPRASAHTNFQQAVASMDYCVEELEELLEAARNGSLISGGMSDGPIDSP